MLGSCLHLARALLKHSIVLRSVTCRVAAWSCRGGGGGRKRRDREGWEGQEDSTVARWQRKLSVLPSAASRLPAGSWGQRGRDGAGADARAPAASRQCPEKGQGAGCRCHITLHILCQQRLESTCLPCCWHHPQSPQLHGDPPRSPPLRGLAKLPGSSCLRSCTHPCGTKEPSLLPPISTGQLFHLSPPPPSMQKIIIGPSRCAKGLKVVNSKGFVLLVFPSAAAQGDFHSATYAAFIRLSSGGNWVFQEPV